MMRIGVGSYFVCSNAFSVEPIDQVRCEKMTRYGEAALAPHRGRKGVIDGFLDGLFEGDVEIVALPSVFPGLGGAVTAEAQDWVEAQFTEAIDTASSLDGLFMSQHGGGAGQGGFDCDGRLFAALRQRLGPAAPLIAVTDGHANISATWFDAATLLIGARTNPHYDFYERGRQAAALMRGLLAGDTQVAKAISQPPMVPSLQKQRIGAGGPMDDLIALAQGFVDQYPEVLDITVLGGWPFADCLHAGMSALVATDGDQTLAEQLARELGRTAWQSREAFQPEVVPLDAAIELALSCPEKPVVLGDVADSGGAATASDGTALLAALLAADAKGAVIGHLFDPSAAAAAAEAGIGGHVELLVGGKVDDQHGAPIRLRGTVTNVTDGQFVTSTAFNAGRQRRGLTAVIDCDGIEVILTSRPGHSFEPNNFRSVGIEPTERNILVAKSEMQHRAGLASVAKVFIDVDTPGISTPILSRLPFENLRRPIHPLDPAVSWQP